MKFRSVRRPTAVAAVMVLASTLASCGDADAGGGGGTAGDSDLARYQEALEGWYEGTYKEPEGPTIKAPADKDVWFVSVGLGIEYSVRSADAAKNAASDLGWKVHVFDAKFDPNQMLTGIQQAVVAKADGIIVSVIDCAAVKNGAQQAADAGIPIVSIEGTDCDPGLYSHVVEYTGKSTFQEATKAFGQASADWAIATTEGKAKAILNTGQDNDTVRLAGEGQRDAFEGCPTCEILDDVTWVSADMGPALQEKIQQAFVKHPDANTFLPAFDAIMTQSGGTQALTATGRLDQLTVGGGEGTIAGIEQIQSGKGMQMCAGQSVEWETYSAYDALARIFVGEDPSAVDSGNGIQVCDKDHNLPPKGEPYTPPVDFVTAYQKLWGKG